MKILITIILSLFTLAVTAQKFEYCLDSKCEFDKPIMPGGYYYGYAYSDYIECGINDIKGNTITRWQNTFGKNLMYQIYVAKSGTWKLIGNIYLCGNHSNKKLYFKSGNRYASGFNNKEPLELDLPQPKTWKVK
ncbi:MAG: hypothetical protein H6587_01225 [Flavobacteriales bacterium]|nr:hypothetical protein [Flavobacteriales bacterium]MCB9363167.1 hypothetical protein [Flavobacteriales bacterium]